MDLLPSGAAGLARIAATPYSTTGGGTPVITDGAFASAPLKIKLPTQSKAPKTDKMAVTLGKTTKGVKAPDFIRGINDKLEVRVGTKTVPAVAPATGTVTTEEWRTISGKKDWTVSEFLAEMFTDPAGTPNTTSYRYDAVVLDAFGDLIDTAGAGISSFKSDTDYNFTVRVKATDKRAASAKATMTLKADAFEKAVAPTAAITGNKITARDSGTITVTLTNGTFDNGIGVGDFTLPTGYVFTVARHATNHNVATLTITATPAGTAAITTPITVTVAHANVIPVLGTITANITATGTVEVDIVAVTTTASGS
jgi:hypothetical protein